MKVLIVDDEPVMRHIASKILSQKYEIVTASSGIEAIELFASEKPDLILSDLRMPEMDGYEMHRILHEKFELAVPVIFMTADESAESESIGFALGAADYIRKPCKADVLLKRVENVMNNLDKVRGLTVQASTDPMTGLLNKAYARLEIDKLIKTKAGALLMIDLDSFKLVNDVYGHALGDCVLISAVELIKRIMQPGDLAGRLGGDEFVCYLCNVTAESALQEKAIFLNDELIYFAKKFLGEDFEIPLGVSVGVAINDMQSDYEKLLALADAALYQVKQHGKHGLAISGEKSQSEKDETKLTQMILSERNIGQAAYFVDEETFKHIYRLLNRIAVFQNQSLHLLSFVVQADSEPDFKLRLFKLLNNSDCITQAGDKILVLIFGRDIDSQLVSWKEFQVVCEVIK